MKISIIICHFRIVLINLKNLCRSLHMGYFYNDFIAWIYSSPEINKIWCENIYSILYRLWDIWVVKWLVCAWVISVLGMGVLADSARCCICMLTWSVCYVVVVNAIMYTAQLTGQDRAEGCSITDLHKPTLKKLCLTHWLTMYNYR